jgi:predicted nucleotidyltransferase/DNA-binding XRE family transcriptional regulator
VDVAGLLRNARSSAGLTQASLARRAGTSQAAVARYETGAATPTMSTLERLVGAASQRLVVSTEPITPPAPRLALLRDRRADIERVVHEAGARNIRVFGSVARGEDGPDSDVDLLVDYDVGTHGAFALVVLTRQLTELLGIPVDVGTLEILRPDVADRARTDVVAL